MSTLTNSRIKLMKTSGEVAAIFGYNRQYDVFATEIYNSLLNNELEWVEFAGLASGKLDDVLIGCKDEIKAYQVKDISGNLSYQKLIFSDTESILLGCYKGWKQLSEAYPNKLISAKYISNEKPSQNDKITKFQGSIKPSFSEFLASFWNPLRDGDLTHEAIPEVWFDVFNELQHELNANSTNLVAFIKSFEFVLNNDFNYSQKAESNYQRNLDIEKISKHIFRTIGTHGSTKFDKAQFLKEFGLLSRYETHFRHSFFVDEDHYQPIVETITKLTSVIDKTHNGYIAIIGNAGSGKSTLLTKWIKDRKEKVLRYYAYVNKEMNGEAGYRGEAEIFLKDLLIQIRENRFSPQENLPSATIPDLQKELHRELQKLQHEQRKVFILVDGLDHIEREQKVNKSLIDILPSPDQVPENIYFILGSRTTKNLDNLPERIKLSLEKDDRTIVIDPLSLIQTSNLIESHKITLDQRQLKRLHYNTKGHPLFLRYTIEELSKVNIEDYNSLIDAKSFQGDIYEEYKIFWNINKLEDSFIEVLGILSRFRYSYVDTSLLQIFVRNRKEWNKIEQLSEHFFYKKGNVWQFFHNSFKEFLKNETSKNYVTNEHDVSIEIEFHKKIFEVAKDSNSDYKWNILYHLFHAQEYEKLSDIATLEFFRNQWFEFRNHSYIFDDIRITSKTSYLLNDPRQLFVCALAYFELDQRNNNFSLSNNYRTFHLLNKIDLANSFIFDNVETFVSDYKILEYALELYKKGSVELAFELLKKAEPLHLLNITKEVSPRRYDRDEMEEVDEVAFVKNWAVLSSMFYPIEEVISKVNDLSIVFEKHDNHDKGRDLLEETIYSMHEFYIDLSDWIKLNSLHNLLAKTPKVNQFYFYFNIVWEMENDDDLYDLARLKLKKWKTKNINPINKRLSLVEVFINKDLVAAKKRFKELIAPKDIKELDPNLYYTVNYIYDYCSLYYIIENKFSVDSTLLVPAHAKSIVNGFFGEFAELGKSSAYLYKGNYDASAGFVSRTKQIFSYFHHSVMSKNYEYEMQQNKGALVNLILKISSKISVEVLDKVLHELTIEWKNNPNFWSKSNRQEAIEYVTSHELNMQWSLQELNQLNTTLFESGDNYSRIEDGLKQIELWVAVNDLNKAEDILNTLMEISLDIRYEKDHQLDYIMDWFEKKYEIKTEEIEDYIKRLESIQIKTSSASEYAAKKLLSLSLPKRNGFEVWKYLLFEGLVNFNDGLEIILSYFLRGFPKNKTFIIKVFTRIILNFDNDYSHRSAFINELFSFDLNEDDLMLLDDEISIHSVVEHRNSYLELLNDYAKKRGWAFRSTVTENMGRAGYAEDSELILKNGNSVKRSEALEAITSYSDLQDWMSKEDARSYFKWSEPVIKIVHILSSSEIKEIVQEKSFGSIELLNIAKALEEKRPILAKELAEEALKKSTNSGWNKYYDGGSKIETYKFLSKITDEQQIALLVFKDFSDNIDVMESSVFSVLDEIFALIDKDFSINTYYPILDNYKIELLKTHFESLDIPTVRGNVNDVEFFNLLLIFLCEFPSEFDDILFETLIEDFAENRMLIKNVLESLYDKDYKFQFIKLLSAVCLIDMEFARSFEREIVTLLNHPQFDIHKIAVRILKKLRLDYKALFQKSDNKIPITYTLHLDYKPELVVSEEDRMKRLNKTGYLRETNDPLEYCNLYIIEIKLLARVTGFSTINIANRIVQLGETYYKQPSWYSMLSEKEIRDIYEHRFDLKISYKRPRYQKVWAGLMMVLKELWQLEIIDRGIANLLSNSFDEHTYFIQPQRKPQFIRSIIKTDNYVPSADKKWVNDLSKKYLDNVFESISGENYIIAEQSKIEGQGDGFIQEVRESFMDFDLIEDFDNRDVIFETNADVLISNYLDVQVEGLCFYNRKLSVNAKVNWLAFNPEIAIAMGLKLDKKGYFRWVDEDNKTVIESIFWKNNDDKNKSRNLHSECGSGWYIVMSRNGLNRLKEIDLLPKYQHQKISRHMRFIQSRYNTHLEESKSETNIKTLDFLNN